MENQTKINCSVMSCIFNMAKRCEAKEISVGCSQCVSPNCAQETECVSFRIK